VTNVSQPEVYVKSSGRTVVNSELVTVCKEVVVAYFTVLPRSISYLEGECENIRTKVEETSSVVSRSAVLVF
jgi:hypothetical protein